MFTAKILKNLENIVKVLADRCVTLEVWSLYYEGEALKRYANDVADSLKEHYPEMEVLSVKKSDYIETNTHPYFHFAGYVIKVSPHVDLYSLKEECMRLEIDNSGKRISDIDVYYKHRKISRKCYNET